MAELRYVQIPKSIGAVVDGVSWSFIRCVVYIIDEHPSFNQTGTGVRAGARILGLLDGKKDGDVVTLDHADWKMLESAFEAPATGYIPKLTVQLQNGQKEPLIVPARAFLGYIEAVSDEATKKMPESKATNGVQAEAPALPAPGEVVAEQPS